MSGQFGLWAFALILESTGNRIELVQSREMGKLSILGIKTCGVWVFPVVPKWKFPDCFLFSINGESDSLNRESKKVKE